jgi:RimJ/RimL family protein N-acetyltransferase
MRKVRHHVRTFGVLPTVRLAGLRAVNLVVRLSVLHGMTVVVADVARARFDTDGIVTRIARPNELWAAVGRPEWRGGLSPGQIEEAFAKGDECVGCFDGRALVSVGWYARTPTRVSGSLTLDFDPAWVYMHRGYTLPAYRGRRLHAIGMIHALRRYTARGARGLISYVDAHNLASLRSVERMGYRRFGRIYALELGGRTFVASTPGCRPHGFRLRSRDEPVARAVRATGGGPPVST